MITTEGIGYMTTNKKDKNVFREFNYFPKNFKIKLRDGNSFELIFEIRDFELRVDVDLCQIDIVYCIIDAYSRSSACV